MGIVSDLRGIDGACACDRDGISTATELLSSVVLKADDGGDSPTVDGAFAIAVSRETHEGTTTCCEALACDAAS
jgi:hypothetical protein